MIRNLKIEGHFYLGLFGLTGTNAMILSLGLETVNIISGKGDYVGGLVGNFRGRVRITSSFWDIDTSGQATSDGGTGLSTSQMQDLRTFLNAGWDFVCETENGPNEVWTLPQDHYPRLTWELEEPPLCPVGAMELDAASFYETIALGVVRVDFYATGCSHCRMQAPIMDEVATQVQGLAQVAKLDIDKAGSITNAYSVNAIPTLILLETAWKSGDSLV